MKPEGHKKVAEEAGIWRLKKALERYGISGDSYPSGLDAFYLGNWLADNSQFYDPYNTEKVDKTIPTIKKNLLEMGQELASLLENTIQSWILDKANEIPIDKVTKEEWIADFMYVLSSNINRIFLIYQNEVVEPLASTFSSKTIDNFLKNLIHYRAYSKFVYPEKGKEQKIEYRVFSEIFKQHYTQYYPHEHFDRPQSELTLPEHTKKKLYSDSLYADEIVTDKYIYKYMEDYIKVIVGQLHELDKNWAKPFLSVKPPINESNIEWHLGLSNFGRSLHLIEDFFAHSNFAEVANMGKSSVEVRKLFYNESLLKKALSGKEIDGHEQKQIDNSIEAVIKVRKRLKKYSIVADSLYDQKSPLEDDESIVTSIFDTKDSIVAILEAIIDLFRKKIDNFEKKHTDDPDNFLSDLVQKIFDDLFEHEIKVVESITGLFSKSDLEIKSDKLRTYLIIQKQEKLSEIKNGNEPLKEDLGIIITELFEALIVFRKILLVFIYLANLIKERTEQIEKWMAKGMPIRETIYKWAKEFFLEELEKYLVKKMLKSTITELDDNYDPLKVIFDKLGKNRIGTHSLLAKDLPQEPLYTEMFNCAKTVHWFVVDAMCRWSDEKYKNNENTPWIDWEHLIFYFLRHPKKMTPKFQVIKREIVELYYYSTKEKENFASIYEGLVDKQVFSMDYLLYINDVPISYLKGLSGGTEVDLSILKNILINSRRASDTGNSSYVLKPGLQIKIPFVSSINVELPDKAVWYDKVMQLNPAQWVLFFEDFMKDRKDYYDNSQTANSLYTYKFLSDAECSKKIEAYNELKTKLEDAYNKR